MKFVLLLTLLSFVQIFAEPVYRAVTVERKSDVNNDLEEFVNLIPADKITSALREYVRNDQEVRNAWVYIHSEATQEMISKIENSKKFIKVLNHLKSSNLDINKFIVLFHELMKTPPAPAAPREGQGLRGFLMGAIRPLIPNSKIQLLATHKYIFSSEFRLLVKVLTSRSFREDVIALNNSEEAKMLEDDAKEKGIDIKAVNDFVASYEFLYLFLLDL